MAITPSQLVIIGTGGFAAEAAWTLSRMAGGTPRLCGFCDDRPEKKSGAFEGLPLLGAPEAAAQKTGPVFFHCAIGDNAARRAVASRVLALGWLPYSITDPTAVIAPGTAAGAGLFIGAHVVVSCRAHIGNHAILNHHTVIGHDTRVGAFTHLCPGTIVSGNCAIGEGAFLASNTTVIPSRTVGAWAIVGAGTTVLRDLPDRARLLRPPDKILLDENTP